MEFFFRVPYLLQNYVTLYPLWIICKMKIKNSNPKLQKQKNYKKQRTPKTNLIESTVNLSQKKDPYGSDWAQEILAKQFGIKLSLASLNKSPKWTIKKVQPIDFSQYYALVDPKIAKDFKSQEKLFQQTATERHRKKLGKVIQQYKQSIEVQSPIQNQQTLINYQQKLPSIL